MAGRRLAKAKRMILGLVLLFISSATVADEDSSSKPEDWAERLEMLRSVPYIALSEIVVDRGDTGVVFYNPEKSYQGYNLYCTISSGEAFLLNMNGRVVHRWVFSNEGTSDVDHAVMLENGDLVAIVDHKELVRVNWDSELIWKKELEVHHDVFPTSTGSFYVLIREHKEHRGLRVVFPAIVHVNADGEEIDRWSTYDHLADIQSVLDTRSFLDTILDSLFAGKLEEGHTPGGIKAAMGPGHHQYDYFHMNTVSELPANLSEGKDTRFRSGNLLVCFRNVNQIAVLEKDTYRVLWAWGEGELEWPHHPTMLKNGHILIFDNGVRRKYSRVVELDPISGAIVWEYKAEVPEDFFSAGKGSAQRLPNGNTLICDSNKGRVVEVTQEGEVVWLWLNPITRQWRQDGRRETVYRMLRLPTARVDKLLSR